MSKNHQKVVDRKQQSPISIDDLLKGVTEILAEIYEHEDCSAGLRELISKFATMIEDIDHPIEDVIRAESAKFRLVLPIYLEAIRHRDYDLEPASAHISKEDE